MMTNTELTTPTGERGAEKPSRWMSMAEIQRRVHLVREVERNIRDLRPIASMHGPSARYAFALTIAATLAVKRCRFLLDAAAEQALPTGGAPVPAVCLELCSAFRRLTKSDWSAVLDDWKAELVKSEPEVTWMRGEAERASEG